MRSELHPIIRQIDASLAQSRPDYYKRLNPPVGDKALHNFQKLLPGELPATFRELYQWKNGQDPECSENFVENWMFTPLQEIISIKEMLDDMIGADFDEPEWWSRGWVPFLSNGGGDHLCINLTGEVVGEPGQLLTFWHDWEDRTIEFSNMEGWLESTRASLSQE